MPRNGVKNRKSGEKKIYKGSHSRLTFKERYSEFMPVIVNIAGKFHKSLPESVVIINYEDLSSIGFFGLYNAWKTFNASQASFRTWALTRINGSILDELRRHSPLPRSIWEKLKEHRKLKFDLEQKLGIELGDNDFRICSKFSKEEFRNFIEILNLRSPVSFEDLFVNQEDSDGFECPVADETEEDPLSSVIRREDSQLLREAVDRLPEIIRKVLALYYFEDLKLREIAEIFKVTESRISQIHTQGLVALKEKLSIINN